MNLYRFAHFGPTGQDHSEFILAETVEEAVAKYTLQFPDRDYHVTQVGSSEAAP